MEQIGAVFTAASVSSFALAPSPGSTPTPATSPVPSISSSAIPFTPSESHVHPAAVLAWTRQVLQVSFACFSNALVPFVTFDWIGLLFAVCLQSSRCFS